MKDESRSYWALVSPARFLTTEALSRTGAVRIEARAEELEHRGEGPPLDEKGLDRALHDGLARWADRPRTASDVDFSILVRKSLDLCRRAAADRELWTCLNVGPGWSYVAWRWRNEQKGAVGKQRVHGSLDRSALARLWWMAELTHGRGDDAPGDEQVWRRRLETLLESQDKAVQLYERPRLLMRPRLGAALVGQRSGKPLDEAGFRAFARSCGGRFGVLLTSALSPERVASLVQAQYEEARGS
jgi:hypothetical protein